MKNDLNLVGIVRLVKTDLLTGEVTLDVTEHNLVTQRGYERIFNSQQLGNFIGISSQTTTPDPLVPTIGSVYDYGFVRSGITSPIYVPSDGVNPEYGEWQRRYNPDPSITRTIWTIFLSETNTGAANCYLKLSSPCSQSTTEVLDIFYRVQFSGSYSTGISTFGLSALAKSASIGDTSSLPSQASFLWNSNAVNGFYNVFSGTESNDPSTSSIINGWSSDWNVPGVSFTLNFQTITTQTPLLKRKFAWSIDRKFDNHSEPITGRIFGLANIVTGSAKSHTEGNARDSIARQKILPDGYPKLQPLHFHSSTATAPFQDINKLATGKGLVTLSGDWTGTSWPEFYRLEIGKTGDTGTSRYKFMKRKFLGFTDNDYQDRQVPNPLFFDNLLATRNHNLGRNRYTTPFSSDKSISYDDSGIILFDHIDGSHTIFDTTSTTPFTTTGIRQVTASKVDGTGKIWVACPNEGLFKLDPSNGNVTKMTFTEGFINDNKAYAVCRGKSGLVWALVEGALVSIAGEGSSYTVYAGATTPTFVNSLITNGANWSNVNYIKANPDPGAPKAEILLVLQTGAAQWYDISDGSFTTGPNFTNTAAGDSSSFGPPVTPRYSPSGITVSETGGLWTAFDQAAFNFKSYILTPYGSSTVIDGGAYRPMFCPGTYLYDKLGNPYAGFSNHLVKTDATLSYKAQLTNYVKQDSTQALAFSFSFPGVNVISTGNYLQTPTDGTPDSGPMRELVWDEYGWDSSGSTWTKDFFGTPPTRINGYLTMIRRGFDVSSWAFDGITSSIVLRNSAPYTTKSNIKSMFITVASNQVADGSDKYLMYFNGESQFAILWIDNSNTGKISFLDSNGTRTVITDRPTDNLDHRLAFTINEENKMDFWLDGALVKKALSVTNMVNNAQFMNICLGSDYNLGDVTHKFKGQIKNLVILDNSIGQTQASLDFTNIANPTYSVDAINGSSPVSNMDFTNLTGITESPTFTYTGIASDVSGKALRYQRLLADTDDWEINFTYTPATPTGGISKILVGLFASTFNPVTTSDQSTAVRHGFQFESDGSAFNTLVDGSLGGSTLGTYTSSDVFKITKVGTTITYYKNGSSIRTATYSAYTPVKSYFYLYWNSNSRGSATITKFDVQTSFTTSNVIGHWGMADVITNNGYKITHTGVAAMLDGISVQFTNDSGGSSFVESDYYTFAGCDGFLKDNIRTLSGDYSLYYRPTEFSLTTISPAIISASTNSTVVTKTNSLWSTTTGLGSGLCSLLGDSTAQNGIYNADFYLIEYDDLNYFSVTLNGTPVVNKKLDGHGLLPLVPYTTGATHIDLITSRSVSMSVNGDSTVWIQLDNGSWSSHTISNIMNSGYSFDISPGIGSGRTTMPYGAAVKPATVNIGEVSLDPGFGLVRFNSGDTGKTLTVRFASQYTI